MNTGAKTASVCMVSTTAGYNRAAWPHNDGRSGAVWKALVAYWPTADAFGVVCDWPAAATVACFCLV